MSIPPASNLKGSGLRWSAPLMKHELRRFHFSDRERTLAGLILSLSWEEGLPSARIPRLEFFTQLTGIPANHVSVTLRDLQLMRVVSVVENDGPVYAINPHSDQWQVKPRQSQATILEAMNMFRELNGLPRVPEKELNFNLRSVALFLAKNTTDSGAKTASVSKRSKR